MGLLSYVRSTVVGKCCKGNFGMSRFLHTNNFQRKLISSSRSESYYENFSMRSYSSLYMTTGTESRTSSARIKMPNIGSEGFACSSYLSTAKRNSRMIHFNSKDSCSTTPVKPETVPKSEIHGLATVMRKIPWVPSLMCGGIPTIAHCDAAEPWQLGFQDAATPIMQGIIDLHHDIFFFLIQILVFVLWVMARALWCFRHKMNPIAQRIVHGTTIEILWTIFPSFILMFIAIPSFTLLYSMDDVVVDPAITIKAIGHQWYWSYEYSDYNNSDEQSLAFDSYMIPEDDLELGQLRLLEVDNRVVVPAKTHLRVIITSADVLHSWAVPSLGVKCDAVPGRLNQISTFIQREGVYYGQCSEICGTNHAFMPIVVEAVSTKDYGSWVSSQGFMDSDSWVSTRISISSRRYHPRSDLCMEEREGNDDFRAEYLCPFCAEDYDVVSLCCHIDDHHPLQAKNGVCPVCGKKVGVDLVGHITTQHGSFLRISFLQIGLTYVQRKRRVRKGGSGSTISILRRELREGAWQSLLGGSSFIASSNSEPDPLLTSFMFSPVAADESSSATPPPSIERARVKERPKDDFLERKPKQSQLSEEDKVENARRFEFVQGLLLSTILDD
ncbi:unnamed protein product [Sphenostylis stenocarpa]|nr:unnamed protein product [Sphenostylis stenocarpa]